MSQVAVLDEGQEGRSSGFTRTLSCNSPRLEGASKAVKAIEVLPAQIFFSRSVIREIVVIVRMAAVILFPVVLTGEELPLTATPRCLSAWYSFGHARLFHFEGVAGLVRGLPVLSLSTEMCCSVGKVISKVFGKQQGLPSFFISSSYLGS